MFKTTNGGKSWRHSEQWDIRAKIISVVIDPAHPSTVYALSYLKGLYKTDNGGGSWSSAGLYPDYVFSLAINPADHKVLLASAENDDLYHSISSAASWMKRSQGLHATSITALATDPTLPGVIYAGTNGKGIFRSGDDGQTWTAMNNGLGNMNIRSLALTSAGVVCWHC